MIRMSRAGRKSLMCKAINAHDKRKKGGALTTPQMAHAAGLVSSTNVLSMLKEMEREGLIFEVQIEPTYQCGYTVRAWCVACWANLPLPPRFIKIAHKGHEWLEQVGE